MVCDHPVLVNGLLVGCGRCILCRRQKVNEWVIRLEDESSFYRIDQKIFLTLTYKDDPEDLRKRDLQLFHKRLRKRGLEFKYFVNGEYGEEGGRPHYHGLYFGMYPDDMIYYKTTSDGYKLYISKTITEIWSHGHVVAGHIMTGSISYVAGYLFSKDNRLDQKKRQFHLCSKGLGLQYLKKNSEKFKKDLGRLKNGNLINLPRYYYDKLNLTDEEKDFIKKRVLYNVLREKYVKSKDCEAEYEELIKFQKDLFASNSQKARNLQAKRQISSKK